MSDKRKRELLPKLKELILELVELDKDIAKMEVNDSVALIRRVKRSLLDHQKNTNVFKKEIDNIRKDIISN
tara:strand:+ start:11545 stop:11757 length:213 start_codon:yes stop_codon:yes gene_type:complete